MSDVDLARRIELERKDAERGLLERLTEIFKTDQANSSYQAAYKRALGLLEKTFK